MHRRVTTGTAAASTKAELGMRFRRYLNCFVCALFVIVLGCERGPRVDRNRMSEARSMMATIIQIDVCREDGKDLDYRSAYAKSWERLKDISWRMNVYDAKSDVTKINLAEEAPATVGADTYAIIKRSKEYAVKTQGAFLISIRPLIDIWRAAQKEDRVPTREEISAAQLKTNLNDLILMEQNQIRRNNNGLKLDLGGNAKGYAIDEVARILREHQIENFYIDAGGDLYVGGRNCKGTAWRIGIRDPRDKNQMIEMVQVSNQAVTTSGNYEQFLIINDEVYSHIINPITGYPQKEVASATVIADTAEEADVYSTALTVLGSYQGTQLVEKTNGRLASLIFTKKPDGQLARQQSSNFENFRLK